LNRICAAAEHTTLNRINPKKKRQLSDGDIK
jgi:hypothetical protein